MQILNYEELIGNQYVHAVFDLYYPASHRTDYNLEVCKSKNGIFYIKFPDIKNRRTTAQKPYTRCSSYSGEKAKAFEKSVMELLKPFLPSEAKTPQDDF